MKNNLKSVDEARKYVETARRVKKDFKKRDEENRIDMSDALKPKESKSYCNNGQLESIGKYSSGYFEAKYKMGEWKFYHENGKLKLIGNYEKGSQIGEWKAYDKIGKLIGTHNF